MLNVLKVVEICNFHNLERLSEYFWTVTFIKKIVQSRDKTNEKQSTLKNEANFPQNYILLTPEPKVSN